MMQPMSFGELATLLECGRGKARSFDALVMSCGQIFLEIHKICHDADGFFLSCHVAPSGCERISARVATAFAHACALRARRDKVRLVLEETGAELYISEYRKLDRTLSISLEHFAT